MWIFTAATSIGTSLILTIAIHFAFLSPAEALQCRQLFHSSKIILEADYDNVYAGQTFVGHAYALYKGLRDAGLNPHLQLHKLSKKQRKILEDSVVKDLAIPAPAVLDPLGRFFLLDGHHTILLAKMLELKSNNFRITIELVYDAPKNKTDWNTFFALAIENQWFYEPTAKTILENPLHVHDLADSVERSMLGLFFISVEDKFKVPMKGKHFFPFIQFYLADLIRQEQIFIFSSDVDFDDVVHLRKTLLGNKKVVQFLQSQLRPNAPSNLKDFLNNLN